MTIEEKINSLGLVLPPAPAPAGSYVSSVRTGNLLFIAGTLPMVDGKLAYTGQIGSAPEKDLDYGYAAAKACALAALANAKAALGSLDKIKRVVNLNGFVNAPAGFEMAPKVINGASDVLVEIFGEAGKHARAAVALPGVPLNATAEVQVVLEVE
ncbi:MAG: RidA family protein [Opitutales bacterium]|nr:RidA family protein [Opitutales bacterium]